MAKIKIFKRKLFSILLLMCICLPLAAQTGVTLKGRIIDTFGEPLPGAVISIIGSTRGSAADEDGKFELNNVTVGTRLKVTFLGMKDKEVTFEGKNNLTIELEEKTSELDEVTVVAFGKQKKESVVASITTINPEEMRVPSSNFTQALAGRIAGIISYQRSGEPGLDQNNAEFFIRGVTTFGTGKKDPLILIDGVEMTSEDLARLTLDDIASFSVMKDANATALYGARGANGVILVTTREGKEGSVKIQFRAELSHSSNTSDVKLADPITYMKLHNEAVVTRDPMAMLPYSEVKVAKTEEGYDRVLYPAVDWMSMLFNDHTLNQRYNLNISGGGSIARYYIAASYSNDNGIINVDPRSNFNNNINQNRYVLRSNVNVNLSKTTEAIVRLHGSFDDYTGPLDGGSDLFKKARNANPTLFLPYYEPDDTKAMQFAKHILFGNYGNGTFLNPYAEMLKGYKSNDRSSMMAQFEVKQDLNFLTEGLSMRGMFNVNRFARLEVRNSYFPFFYNAVESILERGKYMLVAINPNSGTDYLTSGGVLREVKNTLYFETAMQYNRTFSEKHATSGMLVFTLRDYLDGNGNNFQALMPHRNLGLAGRLTYGYDSRYFIETNFGYNGSERFAENERFGFFPSVGTGWIVTNEEFLKPYDKILTKLKLKATYGLVGNDAIGDENDRFYYLSNVNMNDPNRGYAFGEEFYYGRNGISISRYEDKNITWEISRKLNLGLELNLFKSLEIQADYFTEARSNILQARSYMPTTMGLQATPSSNIGKAFGSGIDISVDYNKSFNKDFWASVRGNFTYATAHYTLYDEPDYTSTPWRLHKNVKISQKYGYIAERLFLDDEEVRNSPVQFENYMAGDIKYKDINGDMVINENDQVPIGYPTTPEIIYGWGLSLNYKTIDFSLFFQGSARSSFFIDAFATAPFVNRAPDDNTLNAFTTTRALLQYWADDHWSVNNRNIYAQWPRLSEVRIANNAVTSTWWMRDGSFMRLKNMELGYTLPEKYTKPLMLKNCRIYLSGSNLLVFSKFKMWDVEMAGNGLAYPLQKVINIGLNVDF
ncbi:MAG: TonB-dependent receptor [Tannerella sp.]|jgi:TonB-linked SusC/RagA family outer membrane protein|nr:TonB-dependent receptor [Tannerella sp.]